MALTATITPVGPSFTVTNTTYPVTVSSGEGDATAVSINATSNSISVTTSSTPLTINTNAIEIRTETLAEQFGGEWESLENYIRGNVVRYQQAIYVCILAQSSVVTPNNDPVHWTLIFSEQGLTAGQVIALNRADHLKAWSSSISYSQNDWVYGSNYKIYACINAAGSINNNPINDTTNTYWRLIGGNDVFSLADLDDVSDVAPAGAGQPLVWNGTQWQAGQYPASNIYDFGTFAAPAIILLDLGNTFS